MSKGQGMAVRAGGDGTGRSVCVRKGRRGCWCKRDRAWCKRDRRWYERMDASCERDGCWCERDRRWCERDGRYPGKPGEAGPWFHHGAETQLNDTEAASRCADEGGFDAITLDEHGVMLFFRGVHVWKGFHGPAQLINATWPEIQGPVDAALRIHHTASPGVHDNVYLFQRAEPSEPPASRHARSPSEVPWWRLTQGSRRAPPDIMRDSAHGNTGGKQACASEGGFDAIQQLDEHVRDVSSQRLPCLRLAGCSTVWKVRPPGPAHALQCHSGLNPEPRRTLRCASTHGVPRGQRPTVYLFPGHGHEARRNATAMGIWDRCSGLAFQAFTADDANRTYAFRGGQYFRLDSKRDGWHSWPLNHTWQELSGQVDSAFSWDNKLYLIQGSQVYIYRVGPGYTLVQGYPRGLQEELGFTGADATFTCPHSAELFVIKGNSLERVNLNQSPRSPRLEGPIHHKHVDSAMCNADGVHLFHGNTMYHYASVVELTKSPKPSPPQNVTAVLFGCPH
ncbi:hemopexin [Chelonoidis abingdonii]|uniref:hemopexin n=1 Tax=Chelonoidis abingdonii TaxID=106734 RepID=UPI003F49AF1C